jgi:hypothetical protein
VQALPDDVEKVAPRPAGRPDERGAQYPHHRSPGPPPC